MKKYIIQNICLGLLLLAASHLFAVSPEAEFRKLAATWTLQSDGSQEYRYYQELTLYTHTAMNSTYGETFICYNPDFQELKIHSAYVKQKDGTVIPTPSNAFVKVLPAHAAQAPAYNHLKEMVIVHTGLELGATIYLDYSILSKPGYLPEIDVCQALEKSSPVKEYILTFKLPVSKTASYQTLHLKNLPQKTIDGEMQQLQWTFRNLPAASWEPEVKMQNGDVAALLFSTYPSVQQALQTLYRQMDPAVTPPVAALARELTEKCQDNTAKLHAIHHYITNNLSYCPLSLEETGYRFRPASQVITTAYGTQAEKLNLLVQLLRACQIDVIPAATYSTSAKPEHCGLSTIHELIAITQADGKTYRLNTYNTQPTANECSFLLHLADGVQSLPDTSKATIGYHTSVVLKDRKATATVEATFANRFIPYRSDYTALLPEIHQDTVINSTHTTTIKGKSSTGLREEQDYFLYQLPATTQGIERHRYSFYNSKRTKNLFLPADVEENYVYEIRLSGNLSLCSPLKEKEIKNAAGTLKISLQSSDSTIRVNRSLKLNQRLITPALYPAFRQLMTEWEDRNGKILLLKKR